MNHTKPALLALLALAVSAHANEEESDSHFSLGIGAGYNSGIYKDYDSSRWGAVPLLHYEDQHFYLDGRLSRRQTLRQRKPDPYPGRRFRRQRIQTEP
jgi:hypothetical protein